MQYKVVFGRKVYASMNVEAEDENEAETKALARIKEDGEFDDDDYESGSWKVLYADAEDDQFK